ncbi:unnamed protein product [Calicophoron daubneyi]|uniref:Uncharacterized protein n=1 Tax=Calicophoron daubneyi TaxID=300641 RepID=A0AAV2TJG1_CALDB
MHLLLFLFTAFGTDFVVGTQNSAEVLNSTEDLASGELSKLRRLYDEFKQTYRKDHTGEEDERRLNIFRENIHKAKLLQDSEQGTAEYGVTEFSDMTEEEFSAQYANLHLSSEDSVNQPRVFLNPQRTPESIDWRKQGAVTPVQHQGSCGSCWSFSAIGVIEGQWYRKSKKLIKLSEQQLVDCDAIDTGCNGGFPRNGYKAIRKMGGIQTAASYPYVGEKKKCAADSSKFVAYVNETVSFNPDEAEIADWLAVNGPVSMSLNVKPLKSYKSGIIHLTAANCVKQVTHSVVGVGYGVEKNVPYWLIKNTYGRKWGENGYFRIYRGDGTCGINKFANAVRIH